VSSSNFYFCRNILITLRQGFHVPQGDTLQSIIFRCHDEGDKEIVLELGKLKSLLVVADFFFHVCIILYAEVFVKGKLRIIPSPFPNGQCRTET